MNFDKLKKECLVFDIETSAHYESGRAVDIKSEFENYVLMAQCKWFGAYSYKYDKYFNLEVSKYKAQIEQILRDHKFLIGHNSEDFDYPILLNNYLLEDRQHINVDCMQILGKSTFKGRKGYSFKGRGALMNYNFKNNKLRTMAEVMEVETQKGDIDYKIFEKNSWTDEERTEIIKYLEADVKSTKEIFDKLWDYWKPFTDMLATEDIKNLSWIRSSIASLVYKSACFEIGEKPEYGESGKKESMGGNVIEPRVQEKRDVWYIDFASLYPHIMCMFNLFSEVEEGTPNAWHGNDLFEVKGYYDVSDQHKLSKKVQEKILQRLMLKEKYGKDHPLVYTIKIWINGLYGVMRSPIFKKVHTKNCGWDCCWLGQQIQSFTEKQMKHYGFTCIAGDTDSLMVYADDKKDNNREYVQQCLKNIVEDIFAKVPFRVDTFKIDIEHYLKYVMFPFSEQELVDQETRDLLNKGKEVEGYREEEIDKKKCIVHEESNRIVKKGRSWTKQYKGLKKNYLYIYEDKDETKIELVGLPIKKEDATHLGMKIYNEVLQEKIIAENSAKFSREYIDGLITEYLDKDGILETLAVEYKIKPFASYKIPKGKDEPTGIHAQISKHYLNEDDGIIKLIKNSKIGKVGKGFKYCTVLEAKENKLTVDDLDLTKLRKELEAFVIHVN